MEKGNWSWSSHKSATSKSARTHASVENTMLGMMVYTEDQVYPAANAVITLVRSLPTGIAEALHQCIQQALMRPQLLH